MNIPYIPDLSATPRERDEVTKPAALTVLSFGGGQDSTYLLYRILLDTTFRDRWVSGEFIIVMSDTGAEHPATYQHVAFIKTFCEQQQVPFFFLQASMGFHPRTWPSLTYQFERNQTIMSIAFPRSCTDNLKIKPFYAFLNQYIQTRYYTDSLGSAPPNLFVRLAVQGFLPKYFIKKWVSDHGVKIRVILGIAAGEEQRIRRSAARQRSQQLDLFQPARKKSGPPVWMATCIEKCYPLMAEKIDRKAAQEFIRSTPWPLPFPSNCMYCPYLAPIELLWLYRFYPEHYHHWVAMEAAKIKRSRDRGLPDDKNFGVKGTKLLPEQLTDAIRLHGHLTDEALTAYKMSHGHCVQSLY